MNATASRHRFRFSLRTALILLTFACLVAAWSAYSLKWIRQRQDMITSLSRHAFLWDQVASKPSPRAPGMLWLFGEKGQHQIVLFTGLTSEHEIEHVRAIFPEAEIKFFTAGSFAPTKQRRTQMKKL